MSIATVAFLGLNGWYECGQAAPGVTFTRSAPGGILEEELTTSLRVDLRPILEGDPDPIARVWGRPNLDLNLPDYHVRNLFEGCIGHEGLVDGHLWDGEIETLRASDSVGLGVYLAYVKAQGATVYRAGT